jgi:pimeloyl-ACP methyl ester carboxylesterase
VSSVPGVEAGGKANEAAASGVAWKPAWERARNLLEGVTRRRVPGASREVELAILDWGGKGDLVVMHHANGFCAAAFAPIAKALSATYRVVAIDARGHGDSTAVVPGGEPNPYDWSTLEVDLQNALGAILEITGHERISLGIGHSFGGALMLRVANVRPELFERLLLCDPVILPPMSPEQKAERSSSNPLSAMTRRRRDRFPSRQEAFEHCRSRGLFANFTSEALALYVGEGMAESKGGEVVLKCDREVEAAIFDGGGVHAAVESLDRVSAEVVLVHAERGNFSREAFEEVVAQIPGARVESLDVGHLFPLEQPDRVLELLREWKQRT